MTEETFNKFNNVTCYLSSSTGSISIQAPFASLPQYDINLAPTAITPGLYNRPVAIDIDNTGRIVGISQAVNPDVMFSSNNLQITQSPNEIVVDLPEGVPLQITSSTLDVTQAANGIYTIEEKEDLNTVKSAVSTSPNLLSTVVANNTLTLSPNKNIVTNITSTNSAVLSVTSTDNSVALTPNAKIVTSGSVVPSNVGIGVQVSTTAVGANLAFMFPQNGCVTSITSQGNGLVISTVPIVGAPYCNQANVTLNAKAITSPSSTLSVSFDPVNFVFNIDIKTITSTSTARFGNPTTKINLNPYGQTVLSTEPNYNGLSVFGVWTCSIPAKGLTGGNAWVDCPNSFLVSNSSKLPVVPPETKWITVIPMYQDAQMNTYMVVNQWAHQLLRGQAWGWPSGYPSASGKNGFYVAWYTEDGTGVDPSLTSINCLVTVYV